ncbi:hypothetical protein [Citrobacter sp. Igbk 16]|uniref:hypothetical protein n=1 Tax=Citrobacter sp. Igbk 16 TaxID=2963958 RepID=UPI0023046BDF|nr:hypothetical protein [Citrobacter sp. Igbk 16]MDA8518693.1 hypothetical protein [Citrobacter sp. Igbk 16]
MDYIAIGGLILAGLGIVIRLFNSHRRVIIDAERRIGEIESDLAVLETRLTNTEKDVDVLYEMVRELSEIKSDISEIKGMLKAK